MSPHNFNHNKYRVFILSRWYHTPSRDCFDTVWLSQVDFDKAKAEKRMYCKNNPTTKLQIDTWGDMGTKATLFKAGLFTEFYDVAGVSEDSEQDVMRIIAENIDTGVPPDIFAKIVGTNAKRFDVKDKALFTDDAHFMERLRKATSDADARMEGRRLAIDDVINRIEAIIDAVSATQYHDCTSTYGGSCIDSTNIAVNIGNFNNMLYSHDETIMAGNERKNGAAISGTSDEHIFANRCLWMSLPTGMMKCAWYGHDGLFQESERINRLANRVLSDTEFAAFTKVTQCKPGYQFENPVTKTALGWGVDCHRLVYPDSPSIEKVTDWALRHNDPTTPAIEYSVTLPENLDSVIYTLYVRMIAEMMNPEQHDSKSDTRTYNQYDADQYLATRAFPVKNDMFNLPPDGAFSPVNMGSINMRSALNNDNVIHINQECESGVQAPPYGECSQNGLDYMLQKARHNTETNLRKDAGVRIQGRTSMVWDGLGVSHFTAPSIPSWVFSEKPLGEVFAEWILDEKQCRFGTIENAVCTKNQTGSLISINPWTGGVWNPYERCDTTNKGGDARVEIVDAHCYKNVCPASDGSSAFFANMPASMGITGSLADGVPCLAKSAFPVQKFRMPMNDPSNICFKRPPTGDSNCSHQQGMLGGLDGSPQSDIYREGAGPIHADNMRRVWSDGLGLFMHQGNPVYYTQTAPTGDVVVGNHWFLRMNLDDLGGHHVGVEINAAGAMYINRMPLARTSALPVGVLSKTMATVTHSIASSPTHGPTGWRSRLKLMMDLENVVINKMYPRVDTISSPHWSCPLDRVGFWNNIGDSKFIGQRPLVPNPLRSARLFGSPDRDMLYGTRAHPTTILGYLDKLADITTSNGYCVCDTTDGCQETDHNTACGLYGTIDTILGTKFRNLIMHQQGTRSPCLKQLDWPFNSGKLRDHMISGRSFPPDMACNVLDRLPQFQQGYKSGSIEKNPSSDTSLNQHGSCHMGRAAKSLPAGVFQQTCSTIHKNISHIVVSCMDSSNIEPQTLEIQRVLMRAPADMVTAMKSKRRLCRPSLVDRTQPDNRPKSAKTCSAPPVFHYTLFPSTATSVLPHGPEVSYGIPFRWSTARALSSDMRKIACGGNDTCPETLAGDAWRSKQSFISAYLNNPTELLANPNLSGSMRPSLAEALLRADRPDESPLWNRSHDQSGGGWVLCDQKTKECFGSIPMKDWRDATLESRTDMCMNVIKQNMDKVQQSAVQLNVCDLSGPLDSLCSALMKAKDEVVRANCQMTESCAPKDFIYTPGTCDSVGFGEFGYFLSVGNDRCGVMTDCSVFFCGVMTDCSVFFCGVMTDCSVFF